MKPTPANFEANEYCMAAGWVRARGMREPLLPWISARYFLIFLVCFIAVVAIAEVRLWALAKEGRVVSDAWQAENEAINRMNYAKVKANDNDPLWRSDGIPAPGPRNGKQRILVVGDSFIWGDGYLNANDIWWRQLERELQHRGYFRVEVIGIGVPGASTQDELRWLRDLRVLENLDPDIVVLGYITNDPDTRGPDGKYLVKQIGRDAPIPTWNRLDRTLGRVAPRLTAQLKERLTRKWKSNLADAYEYNEWELKLLEPPNIDAYSKVVQQLGEFVHKSGKPFVAVTLPNWPSRGDFEPRYRPIAPIFAAAGLRFYDVLEDFLREYPQGGEILQWGINPANGHPGTIGTRFYAREVSDLLERDYRSALGPRAPVPPKLAPSINDWMPPSANVRQLGPSEWDLVYPGSESLAPTLPLGKPYVAVAFAQPVAIRRISVTGEALKTAELQVTVVDPSTGVEKKQHIDLGSKSGQSSEWTLAGLVDAAHVNTVKLAAELDAGAREPKMRTLQLRIAFDDPPVRP